MYTRERVLAPVATAISNNGYEVNEMRELENLNPLSEEEGGNAYLINGNMIPINIAGLGVLMGLQFATSGSEDTLDTNEEVKT